MTEDQKNKQRTFIIKEDAVIDQLVMFLKTWTSAEPWEVIVREHKRKREVIQNSLYWRWISYACEKLGMLKEDLHVDLKRRLLVPIYERDDPQYCEMILTLRRLYTDGFKEDSKKLFEQIVKLTSTTSANTKQFAEYLREFERDMASKGIVLPRKEDEYPFALMIKRNS
jgi:hypothetical protein